MNEITTHRKEIFEFPDFKQIVLRAELNTSVDLGRETQHLIEEKIDRFFDEVREIITSSVHHTA